MQAAVDSVSRSKLIKILDVEREGESPGNWTLLEQMQSRYRRGPRFDGT